MSAFSKSQETFSIDAVMNETAEQLGRSYAAILYQPTEESLMVDFSSNTSVAQPAATTPPPLRRIIEAMLFLGGDPLTPTRVGEIIRGLTPAQFTEAIDHLNLDYRRQERPYLVQLQGQGYVLTLRPRYRPVFEKLYGTPREARLSLPAIDVLAVVAYRQPATKQEIDSLRGAESGALLRQLVRRGLIAVVQRGEADQKEVYYGTTPRFLELFQLRSLDDLPQTHDLQRL